MVSFGSSLVGKCLVKEGNEIYACLVYPDSNTRLSWDLFMLLLLTFVFLEVPYDVAFRPPETLPSKIIHLFFDFMFFIDILINCRTVYINDLGQEILNTKKIAKNYLGFWFFVDFISVFPFQFFPGVGRFSQIFRVLKFAKMFRITKAGRLIRTVRSHYEIRNATISLLQFTLLIFFCAHWCGCSFFMLARFQGFPKTSWVMQYDGIDGAKNLLELPRTTQYLASIYWSLTIMSTTGFGDIVPGTNIERIFVALMSSIGAFIFAYGITNMCKLVVNMDRHSALYSLLQDSLRCFLEKHGGSWRVQLMVKRYLIYRYYHSTGDLFDEFELLNHISKPQKQKIFIEIYTSLFWDVQIFEKAGNDFIKYLVSCLKCTVYCPQQLIILQGHTTGCFYIVGIGQIEIVRDFKIKHSKSTTIDFNAESKHQSKQSEQQFNLEGSMEEIPQLRRNGSHTMSMLVQHWKQDKKNIVSVEVNRIILEAQSTFNEAVGILNLPSTVSAFSKEYSDVYTMYGSRYRSLLKKYNSDVVEAQLVDDTKKKLKDPEFHDVVKSRIGEKKHDWEVHTYENELCSGMELRILNDIMNSPKPIEKKKSCYREGIKTKSVGAKSSYDKHYRLCEKN